MGDGTDSAWEGEGSNWWEGEEAGIGCPDLGTSTDDYRMLSGWTPRQRDSLIKGVVDHGWKKSVERIGNTFVRRWEHLLQWNLLFSVKPTHLAPLCPDTGGQTGQVTWGQNGSICPSWHWNYSVTSQGSQRCRPVPVCLGNQMAN